MIAVSKLEQHGVHVNRFARAVPNFGRLGEMTNATMELFRSNDWRDYSDALGAYHFLPGEFDYFLALHSVEARDVQRLYLKPDVRAELAAAMDRARTDDVKFRRSLDAVIAAHPHVADSLRDHWARYGWGVGGAPIGQRALQRARTGITYEEHARQARLERLRAHRNGWRYDINQVVERVRHFDRDKLLALIEELKQLARKRPKGTMAEWRQDAEVLDWSVAACAKRWGVVKSVAEVRLSRLRHSR